MTRILFATALLLSAAPAVAWQDPNAAYERQQRQQFYWQQEQQYNQQQYDRMERDRQEFWRRSLESVRPKRCYVGPC